MRAGENIGQVRPALNYVGGNWNECPESFDPRHFETATRNDLELQPYDRRKKTR